MTLYDIKEGEKAVITKVRGRGAFRRRITEMGFVKGKIVSRVKAAPLNDPIEYSIMGYNVSLRKSEALLIETLSEEELKSTKEPEQYNGVITDNLLKTSAKKKGKIIDVALVGNPNCGKTTIFNIASGGKEKVGNYSGVTVESKEGIFRYKKHIFNLIDLPGTYSLSAYSPEELYVRKYIFGELPDVVINVVDAGNLERNLYLSTQLIDMDIKVIIALNMYDELDKKGDHFDYQKLGELIGIPIIPTIASKGEGVKTLFQKVIDVYEDEDPIVKHIHINYGEFVENSIKKIQNLIWENKDLTDKISSRFYAIKLIEKDKKVHEVLKDYENYDEIAKRVEKEILSLENQFKEDSETLISDYRYGFISGALKETYKFTTEENKKSGTTDKIDNILTHKYLGLPIFVFFLWLMFQSVFSIGQYPMNWIDQLVTLLNTYLTNIMPEGIFADLLIDGVINGVGGVIVFLPNILILFLFISLMEDTGYMARVAFIMDKLMHMIGLHGKSFIPLIMGFGCNVPAIIATRTLENRNDRILTILINPFMSCSARLPVYILIIGAFFPKWPVLVLFSVYMIGVSLAIIMALFFKKTIFRSKETPFVMELPPYRMPSLTSVIHHMWYRASHYLQKMGGIILIASVIIWFLNYFPRDIKFSKDYNQLISQTEQKYDKLLNNESNETLQGDVLLKTKNEIHKLTLEKESERQEKSYIGRMGKWIEPAIRPLGFDWKMGVSLLSGIAAKEIVISTMGVLYQADADLDDMSVSLTKKLQTQEHETGPKKGQLVYTPFVAFAFLMFILIYFPCVAVIAAVRREAGGWKWAILMMTYTTTLAWVISFVINQVGQLLV